jgi:large subunit ribosomal protein L17
VEKLVSKGKDGTLASRRVIISRLGNDNDVKKLCDDISPRYKDREGGYTRIVKLPQRPGDASKMAIIEFV